MSDNIPLKDLLNSEIVALRDSFLVIEEQIAQAHSREVLLDFSNIKFISRSFAQTLLQFQEQIRPNKDLQFTNTISNVNEMFDAVRKHIQQLIPKDRDSLLPETSISQSSLNSFFSPE